VILNEPKNFIMVYGIDYKRFNALSADFCIAVGGVPAPDEVLADDIIAQQKHLKVGDHITLLNHGLWFAGLWRTARARAFHPFRTAQEIAG